MTFELSVTSSRLTITSSEVISPSSVAALCRGGGASLRFPLRFFLRLLLFFFFTFDLNERTVQLKHAMIHSLFFQRERKERERKGGGGGGREERERESYISCKYHTVLWR